MWSSAGHFAVGVVLETVAGYEMYGLVVEWVPGQVYPVLSGTENSKQHEDYMLFPSAQWFCLLYAVENSASLLDLCIMSTAMLGPSAFDLLTRLSTGRVLAVDRFSMVRTRNRVMVSRVRDVFNWTMLSIALLCTCWVRLLIA